MENRIEQIIRTEWDMFQQVNRGGPRAACQDDFATFQGMRFGQFAAWPEEALESYLRDLELAGRQGRNLIEEKYIRMMEHTDPKGFSALSERLPPVTGVQTMLAGLITDMLLAQTEALREAYPLLADAGRPLYSREDTLYDTSVETYQRCELLTYSEATLNILHRYICALQSEGASFARLILDNSVQYYGYGSLEDAQAASTGEKV